MANEYVLDILRQGREKWDNSFVESSLQNLVFTGVDLSGADLSGLNLAGIRLIDVDLNKANLSWTKLRGADLRGMKGDRISLIGADLSNAEMTGADLGAANLSGANLRWADLSGADLRWANLTGADLRWANLTGADLRWADLRWADVSETDLSKVILYSTILPTRNSQSDITDWLNNLNFGKEDIDGHFHLNEEIHYDRQEDDNVEHSENDFGPDIHLEASAAAVLLRQVVEQREPFESTTPAAPPPQPAAPTPIISTTTTPQSASLLPEKDVPAGEPDTVPDWLSGLTSEQPAAVSEAMPDWLTMEITETETPSTDVPDWLGGVDVEATDIPNWLKQSITATQDQVVITPTPTAQTRPTPAIVPVRQASPAPVPIMYTENSDTVQFSAFYPSIVLLGKQYPLMVFGHLEASAEKVREVAAGFSNLMGQKPSSSLVKSLSNIETGTLLTFVPSFTGITFMPAEQIIIWQPPYQNASFLFQVPQNMKSPLIVGSIQIYQGPLIVGEIPVTIELKASNKSQEIALDRESTVKRFDPIFASYSHRDTPVMEYFRRQRSSIGQKMLVDIYDLKSGEYWSDGLLKMIDESAVVQLFWSESSSQSKYCQLEWTYALKYKDQRPRFIQPVWWKAPMPQPPTELAAFHFQRINLSPLTRAQITIGQAKRLIKKA